VTDAGYARRATVAVSGKISGKGLHTGEAGSVSIAPAEAGQGLSFSKNGRRLSTAAADSARCTAIGDGDDRVLTVEHLLAALAGLGVTDANIAIEGPEIPGLDGSAAKFADWIRSLGIKLYEGAAPVFRVTEPIFCHEGTAAIAVYPAEGFSVCYTLDYDHPALRAQTVDFSLSPDVFLKEIAPARTFCTAAEADAVRARGLGKGADASNTLVIGDSGPLEGVYRLPDECARHKVLDLIGDLALSGFRIEGRVVAVRSGHALNRKLVERLKQERGKHGN
jgi:UDP-3-O-acyl N-acetylglucosamine deacetylase